MSNKQRREESMRQLERELKSRERSEKAQPLGVVLTALAVILALVGLVWWAATRDSGEQVKADGSSTSTPAVDAKPEPIAMKRANALPETVSCTYNKTETPASKEVSLPTNTENVKATGTAKVTLETTQGKIGMELDRSVSPCTVNAIEHLAYNGFYDDTVCHRITTSGLFVLQCGDPSGLGSGGPGFQFANEYPTDEMNGEAKQVIYPRGSIAMANAGVDTNGSQFFLNYNDSPLAANYTYFGKIDDEGLSTLDKIAAAGAEGGKTDGKPANEVKITKAPVG